MEKCNLTQVPCRKAIMDVVQANKDRRSLQHIYELAELFRIACSSNEAFMELSEEVRSVLAGYRCFNDE